MSGALPGADPKAGRRELAGLALIVAGFVTRGLFYLDFVPLWDGRLYAECVRDAATLGLSLPRLNCFEHVSAAYIGTLALPQLLSPGSYPLLLMTNLLLGAMAIVYFHRIARLVFDGAAPDLGRLLVTAAFSLHPVLLASAVNINADYGVLVFYLPVVYHALRGQFVRAMLFGIALVFSKESGFLLLSMLALSYLVSHVLCEDGFRARWLRLRASLWMAIPPVLVVLHLLSKPKAPESSGLWQGRSFASLLRLLLPFHDNIPVLLNYLIAIFVLSFQWIATAAIAAGLVFALRRHRVVALFRRSENQSAALLVLAFVSSAYILTRFPTFLNVRYFLPLVPLLLLLAHGAARALGGRALQTAGWLTLCGLFLLSNYYTADPLSRALFGTFPFGKHSLLAMTSRTGECCGLGRDQLVYNLQFTELHYLQNELYEDLRPANETFLAGPPYTNFHFLGPLDGDTFRRTLRTAPTNVDPRWLSNRDLVFAEKLPRDVYYLAPPNLPIANAAFFRLYDVAARKTYERRGYSLDVVRLALKANADALRPPQQSIPMTEDR